MVNKNAKAWVEALRSGEFSQIRGKLGDAEGYCCLGVACEIYNRLNPDHQVPVETASSGARIYGNNSMALPYPVKDWLGLSGATGFFGGGQDSLILHNDRGETFDQIADLIESEPVGLFKLPWQ